MVPDRRTLLGTGVCLAVLLHAGLAPAQGNGVFITVNNPITDKEMTRVKEVTDAAVRRFKEAMQDAPAGMPRPKIVYDFNPDNKEASTVLYGSCWQLADYILGLSDVNTVAFVHGKVTGHTVLPVLACNEIVMSSGAELGDVMRDRSVTLPVAVEQFYQHPIVVSYRNVAERRGRSVPIVLKMLSPDMEVHEGARQGSVVYLDGRLEKKEPGVQITRPAVLPRGRTEPYSADEASRFGLCLTRAESRQELAAIYQLPPASLREDPLQGRTPAPFHIVLRGALTPSFRETAQRRIMRAIGQGANFLVLELECGGGDISVASDLARFIRDAKDTTGQHSILTVAYVTENARDTAAYLALACTHVVMHPRARLGDFERYLEAHPTYAGADGAIGKRLAELAQESHYAPVLAQGMVDPNLVIYRARRVQAKLLERRFITEQELMDKPGEWVQEDLVKPAGRLYSLDAVKARENGFSRYTAENLDQLYQHFSIEPARVRSMGPDWLEQFAAFLRHPMVSVLLIMTGITCLVLELKLPGVGLPGVISALCFILFFWAYWSMAFAWLAVLLFILGLVFLGLEIFVTPGFGVLGISGILMLIGGLALATLERWPQTESEWLGAVSQLSMLGVALVGAVITALVVGRYLPSIPYANRLVLAPPEEGSEAAGGESASPDDKYAKLLGAIGVAATALRPAGTVHIGDDYLDVVAEGSYLEAGTRVQVIEVEGHRIVVKEI